jgi:signal transduction histidine kinase
MELPDAVITRNDRPWLGDHNALAGRRVAVVKGYSSRAFLLTHQPTAVFLDVPDIESALKEVSFGTVDAAVADLASASWLIDQRGITNLRVSGEIGSPTAVTLVCRSDWPELRDILDAGLGAMPDDTRRALRQKWIALAPRGWRPSPRFWVSLTLGSALALVGLVLAWNRSLRGQVTSRTQELERELAERTRIQEEKDQFVAMVTHELRTPLTSLQGALDLLTTTEEEPQRQRFLKMAQDNCLRLIRITNDILDHEKLISRRMNLKLERVDPRLVLHQAVEINRTFAEPLGVELILDLPPIPLPPVLGDPDRLIQVATNLISNAAKWSRRDTCVEVRATLVEQGIRVEVVDHGLGIPKDFQDRLFQPYEQSHTLPDAKIKGTGLGLAICQILLQQHDARLEFHSEEGQGTTFFFTLPLAY